jgi:hypothetical protein
MLEKCASFVKVRRDGGRTKIFIGSGFDAGN